MAAKVRPARIPVIDAEGRRFSSVTAAAIATGRTVSFIWWAAHRGHHGWGFDLEADPSLAARVPGGQTPAPAWSPSDIATAAEEAA